MKKQTQIVKQKDVERLEYFYSIMSDSQKASAAPFPALAPAPPAPPKTPVTVIKSELTWISLNRKGQILLNDKLGTLKSVEAEFKRIQNNKSVSRDIVFRYDKDAPKSSISKVNKLINAYNLVNIYDTLPPPPPPPLAPRVKKGESSNIPPPPPPKQTNQNLPTTKEIIAYNAYAKTIKQQTVDLGQAKWIAPISEKDLVHFTNIYNRMTEKQRNAVEPFPNILPPPAPPKKQ